MSNKSVMGIGEFAKRVGVSPLTIRRQIYKGLIKPLKTPSGRYRFTEQHVLEYLNIKGAQTEKRTVIYARVSTQKQKEYLSSQIDKCVNFAAKNGKRVKKVYTDIASAFNFKRKGLTALIDDVINGEIDEVIVLSKDRLSRIAFPLFEAIFDRFGVSIISVLDDEVPMEETSMKEAVEELVQFVHDVTSKIYGSRGKKTKNITKCVKDSAK